MINRLNLHQFRSYTSARVDTSTRLVVLTGENGAGKTNALEALSLFAPGRGLRGATLDEMKRQHSGAGWGVSIQLQTEVQIGTGVTAESPGKRSLKVNGAAASISVLPQHLSVLWLTPAQDRLFMDAASDRRRFLDRLVLALYPDHAGHVARYEHAMRERLKLLGSGQGDPVWLAGLEARIAEHGVAASHARLETVEALAILSATPLHDSLFPAHITLHGALEGLLAQGLPALAVEEQVKAILERNRNEDARLARTSFSPGRVDLLVRHTGKDQNANQCSTGEQKILLTSLILAQAQLVHNRTGRAPLLLLDEIAAHLDSDRRRGLFETLDALALPCWMTGTDASLFASLKNRATFVHVDNGMLDSKGNAA
jgi:DNA replication and repair protein RecF